MVFNQNHCLALRIFKVNRKNLVSKFGMTYVYLENPREASEKTAKSDFLSRFSPPYLTMPTHQLEQTTKILFKI